jgi:hypothetical protein
MERELAALRDEAARYRRALERLAATPRWCESCGHRVEGIVPVDDTGALMICRECSGLAEHLCEDCRRCRECQPACAVCHEPICSTIADHCVGVDCRTCRAVVHLMCTRHDECLDCCCDHADGVR